MKLTTRIFLLFSLFSTVSYGEKFESITVSKLILSNSIERINNDSMLPGDLVETISNKDDVIYYSADISVINPKKKKYNFKISCEDFSGNIIYEGTDTVSLYKKTQKIGKDFFAYTRLYLRLDTEPGSFVDGQLLTWENDKDYYIKLYFEEKMIGLTKFHYIFKK